MFIASTRNQVLMGVLLVILMVLTRSHYFATAHQLGDATWAIFFVAGIYSRTAWTFLGLLVLAWYLDYAAYTWGGVSDFCVTPAYVFLLPAYGSLWLAGCWYGKHHTTTWRSIAHLTLSAVAGLSLCELLSSGGFYFFSGRFIETSLVEFSERTLHYFPSYAETFVFYLAVTMVIHTILTLTSPLTASQRNP